MLDTSLFNTHLVHIFSDSQTTLILSQVKKTIRSDVHTLPAILYTHAY